MNPDAPKGGTFIFSPPYWYFNQNTLTFNTLNSFALKGDAPPRMELCFEGLMTGEDVNPIIIAGVAFGILGFTVWALLTIKYVRANGQSIAKRMLNIKVVRTDGSTASLGRIFWLRNVVNGLLGVIPLYGIIDPLFIFGETRQCLHDKLADTIVVKA